ncbi:DUF2919 family protein [Alteromonas sp. C1M14]|uniref:DUF2919 family protein n=1 Tax=Alteromonas sp. C1M14 TaxID=2841567 RepID=UPI001C09ABA9|nr:DUF2919 family protein [Alteromonas sp. C1M14]MBU2976976.1 DUF2919 domain-containing protein [Alteromonas sp. C1M14]
MLLPLHCYDHKGRIMPPRWLYTLLLLLCTDWLALIFSLASMGQTSQLLSILYPDKAVLGSRLLATLPFLVVLLFLGNRSRLWNKGCYRWRWAIKPLLYVGIISSIGAQLSTMAREWWEFHWTPAVFLLLNVVLLVSVVRSRHLSFMVKDWCHRDQTHSALHNATDADETRLG